MTISHRFSHLSTLPFQIFKKQTLLFLRHHPSFVQIHVIFVCLFVFFWLSDRSPELDEILPTYVEFEVFRLLIFHVLGTS